MESEGIVSKTFIKCFIFFSLLLLLQSREMTVEVHMEILRVVNELFSVSTVPSDQLKQCLLFNNTVCCQNMKGLQM